jgi:chorismate mutase
MPRDEKRLHALRGATTVERDDAASVLGATRELLVFLTRRNGLTTADVVSALFSVTADLRSAFPARAARELGWLDVPLLCMTEIPVEGSLARCIRILLHVESARPRGDLRHVYLHGARVLRPDLASDY